MAGFRQARGSSNTICKDRRSWRWRCPPRCWSTAWPSDHLAAPQGQQPARPWHRLLLPQPEAPTMPMASPASRFKSMPSTARSQRDRQGHGPDRACRQRSPSPARGGVWSCAWDWPGLLSGPPSANTGSLDPAGGPRWRGWRVRGSLPATCNTPSPVLPRGNMPGMALARLLLPQPDGPARARRSPAAKVGDTFRNAG